MRLRAALHDSPGNGRIRRGPAEPVRRHDGRHRAVQERGRAARHVPGGSLASEDEGAAETGDGRGRQAGDGRFHAWAISASGASPSTGRRLTEGTVSYTHLTLPTNREV